MRKRFATLVGIVALLGGMLAVANVALAANQAANLDQCANDPAPSPPTDGCNTNASQWVNGNLGESKSIYREGDSIAYRMKFTSIVTGATVHTVVIEWDTTKAGKHAIDYLTTWNRTVANSNPCLGVAGCSLATPTSTLPIPADPQVTGGGVTPVPGVFTMWGGTLTQASAYTYPNGAGFAGDKTARITLSFTASSASPVLAWGGHIATRQDWGQANSAVAISGSPYHMRLIALDGSGGNQDRSLSAAAVVFPARITIVKHVDTPSTAVFTFNGTDFTPNPFTLVDNSAVTDPSKVSNEIIVFGAHSVSEVSPLPGYKLGSIVCTTDMTNNYTPTINAGGAGGSVSVTLEEGENTTCTFNNLAQNPALTITKTDDGDTYDSVGDVIDYTIVATNTGNTTLAAVTVTDPNADNLVCVPANGSSLAPGGVMNCTASHTVTQADIDAGSYANEACVNDGANGAAEVCDDVTTPGDPNPSLDIDKVDDTGTFDSVGDVIEYTITATNDGNTTLAAVTVTDPNADNLVCVPANGSSLAPGASMVCTADHTVTQADIDAGSFLNAACVDDGANGAEEACDEVSTPGDKNPSLDIDKVDDTGTYDSVGDVIEYTITATNDGNVTLAAVTVTDPNADNLACVPANGSSLAPGASMVCTADYTVTQADIDAGSFLNAACVDDGANGAAEACDEVTTPGDQNPSLDIDKVDDTGTYDSVGDVIEYTITATNDGNVTLASVTVTDPNASNLVCVPANGSSLAPGASMVCTADHTVTQADIDAGSFLNAACVDDGANGAEEACDEVTTPADQNPALSIVKLDDGEKYDVGDLIEYTIKVTNTGNVTLDGVVVTDPNAQNLVCVPLPPVDDFGPGDEINCTASHTATQADLDAGSYVNEACADDGEGDGTEGAAEVCDDVTTPAKAIPGIATEEVFIPQDTVTLTGIAGATPQGDLYIELRINEQCGEDDSPAWTYTWLNVTNGDYNTADVVGSPTAQPAPIGADATVRWCTRYDGDANNADRPLSSRGEISSIDFDPLGVLGFGSTAVTLVAWALWNRRRREESAAA